MLRKKIQVFPIFYLLYNLSSADLCIVTTENDKNRIGVVGMTPIRFSFYYVSDYLFAFRVNVAPQLFSTSTEEKPASSKASVSCSTVNGVS